MTEDLTQLRFADVEWAGGLAFTGGARDDATTRITIDGDSATGPSPVITLVLAAASCAGADVVSILEKKRITLRRCHIAVTGRRAADYPRRYIALTLVFTLAGEGLTRAHAERAVELSVTKYCSVLLSLNPDIPVATEIVIA
jgi:putative redox protein